MGYTDREIKRKGERKYKTLRKKKFEKLRFTGVYSKVFNFKYIYTN